MSFCCCAVLPNRSRAQSSDRGGGGWDVAGEPGRQQRVPCGTVCSHSHVHATRKCRTVSGSPEPRPACPYPTLHRHPPLLPSALLRNPRMSGDHILSLSNINTFCCSADTCGSAACATPAPSPSPSPSAAASVVTWPARLLPCNPTQQPYPHPAGFT